MAARDRHQSKIVRALYRDPGYAGEGFEVEVGIWAEDIGPVTTDAGVLHYARGAVELHTAAWLLYLTTGELVGKWEPAYVVQALGLDQSTDYRRARTWQCHGMALIEAAKLTTTLGNAAALAASMVTDYRVEGARVMRRGSASCERARAWCEMYERKQNNQGSHDRVPTGMPLPGRPAVEAAYEVTARPDDPRDVALTFYREAFADHAARG